MKKQLLIILLWFLATGISWGAVDSFKYQVLATRLKVMGGEKSEGEELFEAKAIDVQGFKTARIFVQVMESDFFKNDGKFGSASKLRVMCFHKIPGGSASYFHHEIRMSVSTHINGWIEVPIIGQELRLIVWGDGMPKKELLVTSTIYLLK